MLIDSHTHLQHAKFTAEEPPLSAENLLQLAADAGVTHLINIACRRQEWAPAAALSVQHQQVSIAAGIHPQDVAEEPLITTSELLTLAQNPQVVAFGETGLDYYYENSPKAQQQGSFHTHLEAAKQANLPVVIHTRDAEADTVAILKEHPGVPFVLHCFTGTGWLAGQGIDLGGYISFSGILTFKNSQPLRDIAATLPRDKVLIETDAPYLAPTPFRGKRNMSAYLPHTAKVLAEIWQVPMEDVAQITTANTAQLFSRLSSRLRFV